MKRIILFTSLILILLNCRSKSDDSLIIKNNLYGEIGSITEVEYNYSNKEKSNNFKSMKTCFFQKGNNVVKTIIYNSNNKIKTIELTKHNIIGNKTEVKELDRNNKLISIVTFKYNDKGFLIEENTNNYDYQIQNKIVNRYDNQNNKIESKTISNGEEIEVENFKYDINKNLISKKAMMIDGFIETKYKFDNFHNIIELQTQNTMLEGYIIYEYIYQYDSRNNWIKKTEKRNNIIESFTFRKINYKN